MGSTPNQDQILIASQIKRDFVGRTCGTHGRLERRITLFGGEICRKKTPWKTRALMGGYYYISISKSAIEVGTG